MVVGDPTEILILILTLLLLPGIAVLVTVALMGSVEGMEPVKYMAVVGEPDEWERDGANEAEG